MANIPSADGRRPAVSRHTPLAASERPGARPEPRPAQATLRQGAWAVHVQALGGQTALPCAAIPRVVPLPIHQARQPRRPNGDSGGANRDDRRV